MAVVNTFVLEPSATVKRHYVLRVNGEAKVLVSEKQSMAQLIQSAQTCGFRIGDTLTIVPRA